MYRALIVSRDSKLLSQTKRSIVNINSNIEVETLDDPSKVMDVLDAKYIDVVVCDYNPPITDAFQIFSEMTRKNDLRPFMITTEEADGEVAIRAFELRMDYYLSRGNFMNFCMDLASKIVLCTERKRLELERVINERRMNALMNLVKMREKEFGEILNYALEESVALTNSTIGYIAMYDEKEGKLKMEAWSRGGMDRCKMDNRQIVYDFDLTGLWGEPIRQNRPVIVNDYQNDDTGKKKGTPHGHVQLSRLMMIPIYHNSKILATAGVGNKTQEYTQDDLVQFTLLMDGLMSIYHERMLEGESKRSERNLRELLQNAPVGIMILDNDMSVIVVNDYVKSMLSLQSTTLLKESSQSNQNELSVLISNDIEKVRDSGQKVESEHTIERDGLNLVFRVSVAKTRGKNSEDTSFIVVIDDISELALASIGYIKAMERIDLLEAFISEDVWKFMANTEKEMEKIQSPLADSVRNDAGALRRSIVAIREYPDVSGPGPQWQSLEDILYKVKERDVLNGNRLEYNAKGIRILAEPAFHIVFSQLLDYSSANGKNAVKCSIKCKLDGLDLLIRYSDNSAGIPYEKKDDFVSGTTISQGGGIYLALSIIKACRFQVKEVGIPGKGMIVDIVVPANKYSVSWE